MRTSLHVCFTAAVFSSGDFVTLCSLWLCLCFWYSQWVSICRVPLQQIAGLLLSLSYSLFLFLPPHLSDLASACADERWVDTLMSGVCARVWALEKPWELHLLCKCKPLIDCRARSLSFTGWTLPSAGSWGSCQGNVCPPPSHTHIHTSSQHPSLSLSSSVGAGLAPGQSEDGHSAGLSVLSLCLSLCRALVMKSYTAFTHDNMLCFLTLFWYNFPSHKTQWGVSFCTDFVIVRWIWSFLNWADHGKALWIGTLSCTSCTRWQCHR